MRILRLLYALSLLTAALALLAGGGLFDWALEWAHNRALSCSSSASSSQPGGEPRPRPLEAVVVLGYALARDGSPSAALEHRVRSAVREWGRASREREEVEGEGGHVKLVFSGGHPGSGVRTRSEAAVMRSLASGLLLSSEGRLRAVGGGGGGGADEREGAAPPAGDWLLEEASTSTWENAVESLELLSRSPPSPSSSCSSSSSSSSPSPSSSSEKDGEGRGGPRERRRPVLSVSIATSPFHQRRALATFRCAAARRGEREEEERDKDARKRAPAFSFSVAPLASPRPPPAGPLERFERAFEAAREVAAIGWYWARGRLCGKGEGEEENEEL